MSVCFVFSNSSDNKTLLFCLLFWLDVTDFNAAEKRSGDRYLRLVNAWAIFNKYIANGKCRLFLLISSFLLFRLSWWCVCLFFVCLLVFNVIYSLAAYLIHDNMATTKGRLQDEENDARVNGERLAWENRVEWGSYGENDMLITKLYFALQPLYTCFWEISLCLLPFLTLFTQATLGIQHQRNRLNTAEVGVIT